MYHSSTVNNNATNITIIAFRRPDLLHNTLQLLHSNENIEGTPLYVFIDGAREEIEGEREAVSQTAELAHNFAWDGEKKVFCADHNRGLHHAVRFAIDTSLSQFESTIIVEDDIVTSPFFFDFMMRGLHAFAKDEQVGAICGCCYPFSRKKFNPTTPYFLTHFACWGWATWRRAWQQVSWDTADLLTRLSQSRKKRALNFGIGSQVSGLLEDQHKGRINTWDVQTGVSFFLKGQHCLYPPETLTNNTGWRMDEASTHTQMATNPNAPLSYKDFSHFDETLPVETSKESFLAYSHLWYPPIRTIKIILKKIVLFFFPFLTR